MDRKYNIQHSSMGALWGYGTPLIVSIVAALIIMFAGKESGIESNIFFNIFVGLSTEFSFFLAFYLISKRKQVDWVSASGVKTKSPWYYYIIAVILGVLCIFLFSPIIALWERLLELIGFNLTTEIALPLDNAGYLILALFVVGIVPALCEEFLFRGMILNGLRDYGACFSIGLSALFFSLMHMNLQQLPYTFILGCVLGIIVYYTKNIWLGVLVHFINNATALFIMYFTKPIENPFVWYDILIAIVCVLSAIALVWLLTILFKKVNKKSTEEIQENIVLVDKSTRNKLIIIPVVVGVIFLVMLSLAKFGVI